MIIHFPSFTFLSVPLLERKKNRRLIYGHRVMTLREADNLIPRSRARYPVPWVEVVYLISLVD